MKEYTIGLTVSCKRPMNFAAHNEKESVVKAEITAHDADILSLKVDIKPPNMVADDDFDDDFDDEFADETDAANDSDVYCLGCPEYDPHLNLCRKSSVCGEEYGFPPASDSKK